MGKYVLTLLLTIGMVLLSACCEDRTPGKQSQTMDKVHIAKVVQVTLLTEGRVKSDSGDDALGGAIVGAASSESKTAIKTIGCKFSAKIGEKLLYFLGTEGGAGSYSDIEACSLLTPGDAVKIYEVGNNCSVSSFRKVDKGDPESKYRWREFCLYDAL